MRCFFTKEQRIAPGKLVSDQAVIDLIATAKASPHQADQCVV